jgi:hypothetical protein
MARPKGNIEKSAEGVGCRKEKELEGNHMQLAEKRANEGGRALITDIFSDHICPCGCKDPSKFKRIAAEETEHDIWWKIYCDACNGMYALHVWHKVTP